jgi:hypothetical protein
MMSYNGYTNRETWIVCLWIDNEQSSIEFAVEMAQEFYAKAEENKYFTKRENATIEFAEYLKDYYEESAPLLDECTVWTDLLMHSLGGVDWHEIAGHYMEQALENVEC